MDTNALLSIAFSIVSNFCNVVSVPPEAVPQSTNDLATYSIGRQYFPLDMYLRHKHGTQFWIRNGAVQIYCYPGNYYSLQDPRLIPNYVGSSTISSNDVFLMATNIVRRLMKAYDPLTNTLPVLSKAKPYKGKEVPFYRVNWPDPMNPQVLSLANVEVDARSQRAVEVSIIGPAFGDEAQVQRIKNLVFAEPDSYARHLKLLSNLVYGADSQCSAPVLSTNSTQLFPLFK